MTSVEIRQGFLDFFKGKGHTIVPSSSLMPDSPNLLFTNAGMNQFVPIFLGQKSCPYSPPRAADTQKCIRAGGKHNDLEDVGLDTYHHTFFEMLGNWSFGEASSKDGIGRGYFKKETIEWAWELLTEIWKFPKNRLYATVYKPGAGEPSEFDQEAYDCWRKIFESAGLDPKERIVNGNKKDNFWMMGDTGPCGPCSEIHVDLTPKGDSRGSLVNAGSPGCIEIWNLVFIQFNANSDGSFQNLPAKHVDTGAGFERICSILQCTKNFKDFSGTISNYETDVFRPIFDAIEKLSGKKYGSTLPNSEPRTQNPEQIKTDIAFRVIADHIRTLSFAIADGIVPSNEGRGYVLRRILRRAVRYGRNLGIHEPFFHKLTEVLVSQMGGIFPELEKQQTKIQNTIHAEEQSFSKALDRGIDLFNETLNRILKEKRKQFPADEAFKLYDTYGFPLDLTDLMARESGLTVDHPAFHKLMEEQRNRARESQKREMISAASHRNLPVTRFVGYERLSGKAKLIEIDDLCLVTSESPFYAEMGGQVGDQGTARLGDSVFKIIDTQQTAGRTTLHYLEEPPLRPNDNEVLLAVDPVRRGAIQRHHTVTHLFHWALHEVVSPDATQKGSYVGPDRLRFDFNHEALTPTQIADIEKLVNERVLENAPVSWSEVPYSEVKSRKDVIQFFGDKYGESVRVVDIGGYSKELCGGTHTKSTGEIGLFKIVKEGAIAAGVRRIEAVAGLAACDYVDALLREKFGAAERWRAEWSKLQKKEVPKSAAPDAGLLAKIRSGKFMIGDVSALEENLRRALEEAERWHRQVVEFEKELEKQRKSSEQKQAAAQTDELLKKAATRKDVATIIENLGDVSADYLRAVAETLKTKGFPGVAVLAGAMEGRAGLVAYVGPSSISRFQAGQIIQKLAPIIGGGGGGRPDFAQAGGKNPEKIADALDQAEILLS